MTCREKLKIERPKLVSPLYFGECRGCPHIYGYLPKSKTLCGDDYSGCNRVTCTKCWDQEVEEPTTTSATVEVEAETETIDYHAYAKHLRMKYEALIEAGFNEDQAMQLIPMWFDD